MFQTIFFAKTGNAMLSRCITIDVILSLTEHLAHALQLGSRLVREAGLAGPGAMMDSTPKVALQCPILGVMHLPF